MADTVRVRIAVVVDSSRRWSASGWDGQSDEQKKAAALMCLDPDEPAEPVAVTFVEFDVRVPEQGMYEINFDCENESTAYEKIAQYLASRGNVPQLATDIRNATGLSHQQFSGVAHTHHKDCFRKETVNGYSRLKLWSLTPEALAAVKGEELNV